MWVLESEGDLLKGRKIWLKPGTSFLIGRTSNPGANGLFIDNKSVSRQHLVITVEDVKRGGGGRLFEKSVLRIKDGSKIGTTLDSEPKFVKEERVLRNDVHSIRLGSYEQLLKIHWVDVVLTLASGPKRLIESIRDRLERFDIKVTLDYAVSHTTHVISNKRNTAKGLQALINGKWIVLETFVDALEAAAQGPSPDVPSRLEEDFVTGWPKEEDHLPPVGKEPVARPEELYRPDPRREDVFAGFTFVFCDSVQYETLNPVITDGHGKAFYYEVMFGETTVEEFMQYVRGISGMQEKSKERDPNAPVVVKFNPPAEHEEWATEFVQSFSLEMDQRAIVQAEFLDAIIMADASMLRRPLLEEDVPTSSRPMASTTPNSPPTMTSVVRIKQAAPSSPPAAAPATRLFEQESAPQAPATQSAPTRRRIPRGVTIQSRFKGFDDFEPSDLPKSQIKKSFEASYDNDIEMDDDAEPDISQSVEPASQSQYRSQRTRTKTQRTATQSQTQRATNPQKRPAQSPVPPSSGIENEEDMMDDLLSGAAALKKRRLDRGEPVSNSLSTTAAKADIEPKGKGKQVLAQMPKPRKAVESINVKEFVHARREEEDKRRLEDEEALREAMEGVDISTIRGLVTIEEMEVVPRTRTEWMSAVGAKDNAPGLQNGVILREREGWRDEWNGRKNFKKFRRKGETTAIRGQRVIVPLEEVKRKEFGISEEYWLEPSNTGRPEMHTHSQSQAQSQQRSQRSKVVEETPLASQVSHTSRRSRVDEDEEGGFRRRNRRVAEPEDDEIEDEVVEVLATPIEGISAPAKVVEPKKTRKGQRAGTEDSVASTAKGTASKGRKRTQKEVEVVDERPAKRRERVVEESEEDEGRFRFRRKR